MNLLLIYKVQNFKLSLPGDFPCFVFSASLNSFRHDFIFNTLYEYSNKFVEEIYHFIVPYNNVKMFIYLHDSLYLLIL